MQLGMTNAEEKSRASLLKVFYRHLSLPFCGEDVEEMLDQKDDTDAMRSTKSNYHSQDNSDDIRSTDSK